MRVSSRTRKSIGRTPRPSRRIRVNPHLVAQTTPMGTQGADVSPGMRSGSRLARRQYAGGDVRRAPRLGRGLSVQRRPKSMAAMQSGMCRLHGRLHRQSGQGDRTAAVSPGPAAGISPAKAGEKGIHVGQPRAAQRVTTGAVLVAVTGFVALIMCITGFALHMVGFATGATIVGLACIGAGLGLLTQDRRGQAEAARRTTAMRPDSRRVDSLRRTTP
jgi:hypothetical protein